MMKFKFTSDACGRCGSTGKYPSTRWNGVCAACNGTGRVLTRAGKASKTRYIQWQMATLEVRADALVAGQSIRESMSARAKRVETIRIDSTGKLIITFRDDRTLYIVNAATVFYRLPTNAEHTAIVTTLGKGVIISE